MGIEDVGVRCQVGLFAQNKKVKVPMFKTVHAPLVKQRDIACVISENCLPY